MRFQGLGVIEGFQCRRHQRIRNMLQKNHQHPEQAGVLCHREGLLAAFRVGVRADKTVV